MADGLLSRYPSVRGNARAMAMFSVVLRDKGFHDDAVAMALAAMEEAPDSMMVRNTIGHAFSAGVQPFHVPMLLDDARNKAYARAIARMVRPGMRVLEIGTGGGLLAMLCARAGAVVTTCEAQPTIAATARRIIESNGLTERIRVVAKQSDALQIPEDMDAPAELVVHEIFGARLIDENVTAAIRDARARLLQPGAPALPPRAEIRCALGRSSRPSRQVGMVEGFDMSAFNLLNVPGRQIRRGWTSHIERCSESASALRMDYDSPPPFGPAKEVIRLTSTGGRIDGVLQWIRLDFGEGEMLENDPFDEGPRSSWGQSMFDLRAPIETAPGDVVEVTFSHDDARLMVDAAAAPRDLP